MSTISMRAINEQLDGKAAAWTREQEAEWYVSEYDGLMKTVRRLEIEQDYEFAELLEAHMDRHQLKDMYLESELKKLQYSMNRMR